MLQKIKLIFRLERCNTVKILKSLGLGLLSSIYMANAPNGSWDVFLLSNPTAKTVDLLCE